MLGVLVNTFAIVVCSVIGLFCKKIITEKIETVVMQGLGVCVFLIGVIDAIKPVDGTAGILVLILSFTIG